MAKFKLLGGSHREGGVIYEATSDNNIITSGRELDVIFKNKFERLSYSRRAEAPKEEPVEKEQEEIKEKTTKSTKKDVSGSKFTIVHKGGGRYNVVRTSDDEKINDSYLTKVQAEKLAGAQAQVEDEDETIEAR